MLDSFIFYRVDDSRVDPPMPITKGITRIARKPERKIGEEILLHTFNNEEGIKVQLVNLPKAGAFMFGQRFLRYQQKDFDPIKFMDQYAINSELFRKDKDAIFIPYCQPITELGSNVLKSFQINNFVFVIKRTTNLNLPQVLALQPGQQARHYDLKLEVFEILAHVKHEENIANHPPICLSEPRPIPVRIEYSLHYHGFTKLFMQPRINAPVVKIQNFMRFVVFKRRCLRRQALLALCMSTHERLGAQSSAGLARLIEDPNCSVIRCLIAPLLLVPRTKK